MPIRPLCRSCLSLPLRVQCRPAWAEVQDDAPAGLGTPVQTFIFRREPAGSWTALRPPSAFSLSVLTRPDPTASISPAPQPLGAVGSECPSKDRASEKAGPKPPASAGLFVSRRGSGSCNLQIPPRYQAARATICEVNTVPMTAEAEAAVGETPGTHAFQADVARLLDLMVHSIYSERDIFIRELISNAADACEKLRYEAIAKPELVADGAPFLITVSVDKDKNRLTVADNGVGMTRAGPRRRARHHRVLRHQGVSRQARQRGRQKGRSREPDRPVRHRLLLGLHGGRARRGGNPPGRHRSRLRMDFGRQGLLSDRAASTCRSPPNAAPG